MTAAPQLAVIGDLHGVWAQDDVDYFNGSAYETLLFTGDLGGGLTRDSLAVARSLAGLKRRTLVLLGNNDAQDHAAISAELTYLRGALGLMDAEEDLASPQPVRTCGFSAHPLELAELQVTLIAGRPFAMGGNELSFPAALRDSYGVTSLEESRDRLRDLVDRSATEHLLFLAHNGPTGRGMTPSDPWGRDFGGETGDWGDDDLSDAVAYARERGRRPLAVIAGHMHWSDARPRRWCAEHAGTLYINAARVPRVFDVNGGTHRLHLALTLTPSEARVELVQVPGTRNRG